MVPILPLVLNAALRKQDMTKVGVTKIILMAFLFINLACGQQFNLEDQIGSVDGQEDSASTTPDSPTEEQIPTPVGEAQPNPSLQKFTALAWEQNNSSRKEWSKYVHSIIENEAFTLLDGADDMNLFCPRYSSLNKTQKINFWGQLIAAIAKFESSWNPATRYHETTMGTDPITKQPVYSEGLLQLSYQDTQWEKRCEFNWTADRNLAATDPKKTILNPYKNLRCGILILERQLNRAHRITVQTGAYWAVIRTNGRFQKINEIAAITKSLSFCK